MAQRLDFTATQRKRLKGLGVIPEQVEQLRGVLPFVQSTLDRPAAKNGVKAVLDDVAKHAHSLLSVLEPVVSRNDAERSTALDCMDDAFLDNRRLTGQVLRSDEGETAMRVLIPQLKQLRDAARSASRKIGPNPKAARHRRADPMPVKAIDGALRMGWADVHAQWTSPHNPGEPLPRQFEPSKRESSTFRKIVGVCYEAAGADIDADPVRAIEGYMREVRASGDVRRIIELQWLESGSKAPASRGTKNPSKAKGRRGKNRTSRKT